MKNFSINSMIVGIGIGMIIVGIINIFLSIDYSINDTSQIFQDTFIKIPNKQESFCSSENQYIATTDNIINNDEKKNNAYHEVYIHKGMNSEEIAELLKEKEVIDNKDEFIRLANKLGVTNKLKYGLKKIPLKSSIEEVLKILIEIN